MITHSPLNWWLGKFINNQYFSLARFGDGEWLCIQGKQGANSHGCNYTPELRQDLIDTLKDYRLMRGMQRILPRQLREVREFMKFREFVDTEIFGDLLAEGKLKPLFDILRKKHVVIVSSANKRQFPFYNHFIETPLTNTHLESERIIKECLAYRKPAVYLFCCGMAAGTLIHKLHGKIQNSYLIDFGHLLDPFIGDNSREYLKHIPQEIINQNL